MADDVNELLKKLDQNSLNELSERAKLITGGGSLVEKYFLNTVIALANECGKKADRRWLELRSFLQQQMMNEDA